MIGQHRQRGPAFRLCSACTSSRTSTTGEVIDENADPSRGTTEPGSELTGEASASNTRSIDRLDRIERFRDVAEQDLRVVVPFVDRHPRERLAVALGPLRQQRRLPVTRRRDHRHNRAGSPAPAVRSATNGAPSRAASADGGASTSAGRTPDRPRGLIGRPADACRCRPCPDVAPGDLPGLAQPRPKLPALSSASGAAPVTVPRSPGLLTKLTARPVVPTAAWVWSSNADYHLTITPWPCGSNIELNRMMPDHQVLRPCFPALPGDEYVIGVFRGVSASRPRPPAAGSTRTGAGRYPPTGRSPSSGTAPVR